MKQFDQNEPTQIKSPKTVLAIVIIAILVTVLVGFGIYMLQLQRVKNLEKQLSQTNKNLKAPALKPIINAEEKINSNTTSTNEIKIEEKIENWQTYKDIKNGIEFKYPNGSYTVYSDSANLYGWSNSIALLKKAKNQSYSASLAIWNSLDEFKKAPNNITGVPKYYIQNNSKYITFDYWDDNEAEIMKKIISTLKISNNTTTNSATTSGLPSFLSSIIPATYSPIWNWSTFSDSQFGYDIKYPKDLTPILVPMQGTNQPIATLTAKDEGYVYKTASFGGLSISVLTNNSSLDIYNWMKKYQSLFPSLMSNFTNSETKYNVDSKPALRYYYNGSPQTYPISKLFFVNGKYTYLAQCSHNSYDQSKVASTEKNCLEILSTFKFGN